MKRVTAAYNRPDQRDTQIRENWGQVVFNNIYPEPGIQQLLHRERLLLFLPGSPLLSLEEGTVGTASRTGPCHPHPAGDKVHSSAARRGGGRVDEGWESFSPPSQETKGSSWFN